MNRHEGAINRNGHKRWKGKEKDEETINSEGQRPKLRMQFTYFDFGRSFPPGLDSSRLSLLPKRAGGESPDKDQSTSP